MELRFVDANGLRFGYLQQGTGPLVLLLHGFPDTAHTWDRTMAGLADAGFRAVAPFMRGYAPTQIPADGAYDIDTLGHDVLALIDALGGKPAIVVGHDWGASAAYASAALAPSRVRLLVALALPHPRSMKPTLKLAWALRHFLQLRRRRAADHVRRDEFALVDELWRRWSPAWTVVPASETAHVKLAFREPGCLEAALGYYRALGFRQPASLEAPIEVPTIAFAGEQDVIPTRAYERARRWFSGRYEVVPMPGGHFAHREHPGRFVLELVRALREHVTPTARA